MSDSALIKATVLILHTPSLDADALVRALMAHGLGSATVPLVPNLMLPIAAPRVVIVQVAETDDEASAIAVAVRERYPGTALVLWPSVDRDEAGPRLDAGFDVWLPATTPEARVAVQARALCRLLDAAIAAAGPKTATIRNTMIDFQLLEVRVSGEPVPLTPTELRIFAHLARMPGQVAPHTELFREVHGYSASEQEARDILKVHIWRLRSKLTAAGAPDDLIANVRGFGYLLERRTTSSRRKMDCA